MIDWLKIQMDKLRAEASRGAVSSATVFALTDPIMDRIARYQNPQLHACCGHASDGPHNDSCPIFPV